MNNNKADDIDAKIYAPFSCVDCRQEFESYEELEKHEIKHKDVLKTDKH
jgi:hypothetical protein